MDDNFYAAFLEGDCKVLNKTLQPFSMWHLFLLEALESPLISGGKVAPWDVLLALEIFQTQFPNEPRTKATLKDSFTVWRLTRNEKRLQAVTEELVDYIKRNTSAPKFWQSENTRKGGGRTSPEVLQTVTLLISKGWDEYKAWDLSYGRAKWYEAVYIEETAGDKVSFLYEWQLEEEEDTLAAMTEEEIYEQAIKDLGQKGADAWFARRQEGDLEC